MSEQPVYILGIESSCDETSAAVLRNRTELSNIIASQTLIHRYYGGVVPELASRAHQQKIIPVVEEALNMANITKNELQAVAVTRGPGLMGALLVGMSFTKTLSLGLGIPLIEVNHMQGHVLAHFIQSESRPGARAPEFPFLCLTVSGGHTQIVRVNSALDMYVIGETLDDAAGEAFDKAAKILGLPYPGGPLIDKYALTGDPKQYNFPKAHIDGLNFSFSGLKTAFLYFIREQVEHQADFIEKNLEDICAGIQNAIVNALLDKLTKAVLETGVRRVALAGGVSANSELRRRLTDTGNHSGWEVFIPPFEYCTDNAAMIAIAGHYKYLEKDFAGLDLVPMARMPLNS